mgnify:CR=1 FL=1
MLEGLKVVEMATYIAAPGAGGILADWGAEVIKIEPLSGCPMRYTMANVGADHLKGSPIFDLDNRGKKGLAINTATPEGVAAVKRLVEDADVFITNVRPGGLERAGLDYDEPGRRDASIHVNVMAGEEESGSEERDVVVIE